LFDAARSERKTLNKDGATEKIGRAVLMKKTACLLGRNAANLSVAQAFNKQEKPILVSVFFICGACNLEKL
jgi:hypothetical protein